MKRIYNDIPVQSALYYTPGYIMVTIYDVDANGVILPYSASNPRGVWHGFAKESQKMPEWYKRARIRHMEVPGKDQVVYYISTLYEQF